MGTPRFLPKWLPAPRSPGWLLELLRAAEGGDVEGAGEELRERAEAEGTGVRGQASIHAERAAMRSGMVTMASWKHQFSGKKGNKGENARINSQRAREQYREQLEPASLLRISKAML